MIKKYRNISLLFLITTISFAQEKQVIKWWNPVDSEYHVISGQAWPNEVNTIYHRLPARAEENVRKAVWNLSKQSAGLSIRFWSNSNTIRVKYKVKGKYAMPHMPSTGQNGLDLYSKSKDGEWLRSWGKYSFGKVNSYNFVIDESSVGYKKYGREYQLFLPLYNETDSLEIGVSQDAFFEALPIRKDKPIVAYGTSICQGACASRPGMAWTNILERKLERPVINLGFSGNGKLEPELIDLMAEIDAKAYVLDCLPNLNPNNDDTYQLILNAVHKLKEKRPDIPVILTSHIGYASELTNKAWLDWNNKLNKELNRAFSYLKSEDINGIFLLQKEDLSFTFEEYVDNIHPNDLGMMQYANVYEKLLREVLHEKGGSVSTTIPSTQSRDIGVYKWEERHQSILTLNKVKPPKICLFGNSITNFWGGAPKAPIARGEKSWNKKLAPLGVHNYGFGWDRIENVLWRVHHDELDGFEAEQIVLMIGTNNLHINTEDEIIEGLSKLIKAIRIRQPKSRIVMIGILPRNGKEAKIEKLNLKIAQMADLEGIDYEQIGGALVLDNGKINESLFTDGLHPNSKGYKILAKDLQQVLKSKSR